MNQTSVITPTPPCPVSSPSFPLEERGPASSSDAPERRDRLGQKIARLPKATRDMLNLMLDDGLPYRVIIEELGETAAGLNPGSLTKWVESGYEDYLKNRAKSDEAKTQAEFAADLLRELGNIDVTVVHHACMALAMIQIYRAIEEYGDEALRKMLHTKPASFISLLNALCNSLQPMIDLENHRIAAERALVGLPSQGSVPEL